MRSVEGSDEAVWAACSRSRGEPGGQGGGLGALEGEEVRGVCALGAAREGRAPQAAAVEANARAKSGGGVCVRGGVCCEKGWGGGSSPRRGPAPAQQASGGRGYRAARKAAQAMARRSGAQELGRVSGRASQLCLRASGNMAPRTALPDVGAEGVVRPWCRGERQGEQRGGGLLAAAFGRAGVRVAWDGRPVGGGVVECGGGGVPGLPVVTPALDREGPALGMLYYAGGQRGEQDGVKGGGDGSERIPAAGLGVSDVHDGL